MVIYNVTKLNSDFKKERNNGKYDYRFSLNSSCDKPYG